MKTFYNCTSFQWEKFSWFLKTPTFLKRNLMEEFEIPQLYVYKNTPYPSITLPHSKAWFFLVFMKYVGYQWYPIAPHLLKWKRGFTSTIFKDFYCWIQYQGRISQTQLEIPNKRIVLLSLIPSGENSWVTLKK